jgi:hypothetical protein
MDNTFPHSKEGPFTNINDSYGFSDPLSQFPMLLRMMVKDTGHELSLCTGFIYEYEDMFYIITNGHCVTGVNPENNKRLSSHAGYPTSVRISFKVAMTVTEEGRHIATERPVFNKDMVLSDRLGQFEFSIYLDDDYTQPRWYIHPEHGYNIDVVAIPLTSRDKINEAFIIRPINHYISNEVVPHVTDEVYILGYPFGITDAIELPIWKRGSIATEPSFFYKGLPRMLVDTATRPGMSGSPVILAKRGIINVKNDWYIGAQHEFIGIYSGRIGTQEESAAQLGIIWRKQVIGEILAAKVSSPIGFQNVS